MNKLPVDLILVPQGQEFAAIQAGCRAANLPSDFIQALPVGPVPVCQFLQAWQPALLLDRPLKVLVMGLCGALTSDQVVGDIVLYETCLDGTHSDAPVSWGCDPGLNVDILKSLAGLKQPVAKVTAVTTDRVVFRAKDKAALARKTPAQVVDMEGVVLLQELQQRGMAVAMLRVVSDGCAHDLPDLSAAFSSQGDLLPLPLAIGMLQNPLAALRLIRGSLAGLTVLKLVAHTLVSSDV